MRRKGVHSEAHRRPPSTFTVVRKRNDQEDRARKGTRGRNLARPWLILGAALLVGALLAGVAMAKTSAKPALKQFKMVRSESAAAVKGGKCLNGAYANVRVTDAGQGNQNLYVTLNKAAKNTEFTVFVLQQPNSPFG